MKVAIIGAGWAGLSAAVHALKGGADVTLFEAARTLGGRARSLDIVLPNHTHHRIDNGQHILIGAYTETLALMRTVGVDPEHTLLRQPLELRFPDHTGLKLPRWPAPWDVLLGVLTARGWTWRERVALLHTASGWQRGGFRCEASATVAQLCHGLPETLMRGFIDPLCVSALNTPAAQASGQVFLRVLHDGLFGVPGGSHLLLPRQPLSALLPEATQRWIEHQHPDRGRVHTGARMRHLSWTDGRWQVDGLPFDRVVLATGAPDAARLVASALAHTPFTQDLRRALQTWHDQALALRHEAIATVYAWHAASAQARRPALPRPMTALRTAPESPAQFVFDHAWTSRTPGLLAFVVSASQADAATLQAQVLRQAERDLGLPLQSVRTVVEKRATFACTPNLQRPPPLIAPGLLACADHVAGPYPATLEGAVRHGLAAARAL